MNKLLSKHVMKQNVRNSWKMWTILTVVLSLFITMITVVMNSPANLDRLAELGQSPPNMTDLYAAAFFGASGMGILLMLVYLITTGNKLVASEVDRGTMSFILNTPTTRKQIIFTKALFYIGSMIVMILTMGLVGITVSSAVGANINIGNLWLIILGALLFGFAISGICFFASCWFNKSSQSLMVGAGLPVAFFLFASMSPLITLNDAEFLKYFSLNTLFDTTAITGGDIGGFIGQFIAMFAIGAVLYVIGITKFLKKDLPL
ncbi:MAG: ABC transporter permease [Firmicutes bacterium]|nr:ABC transporter permease [Bacillota bacterium]